MPANGKVTSTTVSAFKTQTWIAAGGGELQKGAMINHPKIGSNDVWGIAPGSLGGVLKIDQATFNSVTGGTPNNDATGTYQDTSNALGGGSSSNYNLVDDGAGNCVAQAA